MTAHELCGVTLPARAVLQSGPPVRRSITGRHRPSCSTKSYMGTTWGCSSDASSRASAMNRLRTAGSAPNSRGSCLMATSRPSWRWRPASTMPHAPWPSSPSTSYSGRAAATASWSGAIRASNNTRRGGNYRPVLVGATLRARLNGQEYQFEDGREIRVGRDPSADMVSANPYVSREHAVVRRAGDGWVLEDQGSRGGTYLGDQRVSSLP